MARIYIQDGAVSRVDLSDEAAGGACEFDPTTNPDLAHALTLSLAGWTVVDGTLRRDGVAVVLNPPSDAYRDRLAIAARIQADAAAVSTALATLEEDTYPANDVLIPALRAVLRAVSH